MSVTLLDLVLPSNCIVCGRKPKPICPTCQPKADFAEVEGFGFPVFYAHQHHGPIEKLISGYKDQQLTSLEKTLAESVAQLFSRLEFSEVSTLVLPARSTKNFRKRGFDPAKSLAQRALRVAKLDVQVVQLTSVRARQDQRVLGREERARNVYGSMRLPYTPRGKLALFDDVMTTGSTFSELARACEVAGAKVAFGCVLAQRFTQF